MKAQSTGKYNKGFATLEILIAFAVLILSISAVILLVFGNQSIIIDSQTNSEALYKAQKMLEEARAASKFDFNLVNPIPNTADDIYTKNLAVSMVDFFTKNVTSNITWKVDGGRDQTISLYTLITNPDAINGGDTCNSVLGGDWAHPKLLGDVDVGQNNGATDVDVFMGKAYVTTDPSSVPKEDFHVIDVGNPNASPLPILKSINTGPGLVAVQVAGRYAYAANTSINGPLQVREHKLWVIVFFMLIVKSIWVLPKQQLVQNLILLMFQIRSFQNGKVVIVWDMISTQYLSEVFLRISQAQIIEN